MHAHSVGLLAGTVMIWAGAFAGCSSGASGGSPSFGGAGGAALGGASASSNGGGVGLAGGGASSGGSTALGGSGGATTMGSGGAVTSGGSGGASALGGSGGSQGGSGGAAQAGAAGSAGAGGGGSKTLVVMYLDNYSGVNWTTLSTTLDFSKMTHLNLAFALGNSKNDWDMGESDADVKAIVDKAHAAGVKVLASLGGGAGSGSVSNQFKTPANVAPMVANLDAFLKRLNLDGADIDVESGSNLGAAYATFVAKTISVLRPEGKLVTAAVAQYLTQGNPGGPDKATLQSFDFINLMIYGPDLTRYMSEATYWTQTEGMPKEKLAFGVGFHGSDTDDNVEYSYAQLMKMDANAWNKTELVIKGVTIQWPDVANMKAIANFSKGYGGIMIYTLLEDVDGQYSLWKAIQDTI
jgi:chitinase